MLTYEPFNGDLQIESRIRGKVSLRLSDKIQGQASYGREGDSRVWVKSRKDFLWVRSVSKSVFRNGDVRVEIGLVLHLIGCNGDEGTTTLDDVVAMY